MMSALAAKGGKTLEKERAISTPFPSPTLPPPQHIRHIADPEHPLTLEQLGVVTPAAVTVTDTGGAASDHPSIARVRFTPTVAHCSMATLIGLALRTRLASALPARFKLDVAIAPGTHSTEDAVNRQLADKERVAAALENPGLAALVARCLAGVPE